MLLERWIVIWFYIYNCGNYMRVLKSVLRVSVALLFSVEWLSAQSIDAPWLTEKKLEATPKTLFDNSHLRVYYQLYYRPNHEVKDVKKEALTVLLVGDKALMYEDYNTLRCDSLERAYVEAGKTAGEYMGVAIKLKTSVKDKVITLFDQNKIIYALNSIAFNNYYYEEEIPTFDWQLWDEQKTISGLECRKATMHFRGRDYVAWYSTEVALPYGPYKFGGLPGIIVEIYDTEMDYQFTLVQMQQGNLGDQIGLNFDNNRLMKTSRANAMRALENYRKDPGRMISQKARRIDGKPLEAKAIPHNPIELK